jgi:hypothetical protein
MHYARILNYTISEQMKVNSVLRHYVATLQHTHMLHVNVKQHMGLSSLVFLLQRDTPIIVSWFTGQTW